MIRGIGTDIVEIDRISRAIKKDFFLKKAFTYSEIEMAKSRNTDSFLAGNFAVKLKDLEVLRDDYGKPFIRICNISNVHLKGIAMEKIHVSISNTNSLAIAMVVIESD